MVDSLRQLSITESFSPERPCFLLLRLQAAESCTNLLVGHAYLIDTLVASARESFAEGYSSNYSTMTIPVPLGSTVRIERDKASGDAGTVYSLRGFMA